MIGLVVRGSLDLINLERLLLDCSLRRVLIGLLALRSIVDLP